MATAQGETRRAILRDIDALGKITVQTTDEKGIFKTYRGIIAACRRYLEAEEEEELEGRAAIRALASGEVRR
jgi:hypothetical protein